MSNFKYASKRDKKPMVRTKLDLIDCDRLQEYASERKITMFIAARELILLGLKTASTAKQLTQYERAPIFGGTPENGNGGSE